MNASILPLYVQHLGASKTVAGLMMSVFTIASLCFRPISGYVIDNHGSKRFLILGITLIAVSSVFYGISATVILILIFRAVNGVGFSISSTGTSSLVSEVTPKERMMEGIGFFGISVTIAGSVGPAVAIAITRDSNYRPVFLFSAAITIVSIILIAVHKEAEDKRPVRQQGQARRTLRNINKAAFMPAAVMLFVAMAQISITVFVATYAISLGIENSGLFFTFQFLAMMFTRPIFGKLSDRRGPTVAMIPGVTMQVLSLVALCLTDSAWMLFLAGALNGVGFGILHPVLQGLIIKLGGEESRGSANSLFYSATDIGYGIGSLLWGAVSDSFGFSAVYASAACFSAAALAVYFVLKKKLATAL